MSYYWESVNHDAPRERITDDAMAQILDAGEAGGWNVTREDGDTVRAVGKLGGTVRHYVRRGAACECDTTEYLPCEQHAETLAQWNGSSSRSADQLVCLAVRELARVSCERRNPGHDHDATDNGCVSLTLSDGANDVVTLCRVEDEISSDPFTSWANDWHDSEAIADMCRELENSLPFGVVAHWDDGFTLWRITGGPLLED